MSLERRPVLRVRATRSPANGLEFSISLGCHRGSGGEGGHGRCHPHSGQFSLLIELASSGYIKDHEVSNGRVQQGELFTRPVRSPVFGVHKPLVGRTDGPFRDPKPEDWRFHRSLARWYFGGQSCSTVGTRVAGISNRADWTAIILALGGEGEGHRPALGLRLRCSTTAGAAEFDNEERRH